MRLVTRRVDDGSVLIWTVLFAFLLIAVVALSMDTARVLLSGHQLQNAADAAALAGALRVRSDADQARVDAYDTALANSAAGRPVEVELNPGNAPTGDIVLGIFARDTRTFNPSLDHPNAVKVVTRRTLRAPGGPVPLVFGPAFGVPSAQVSRYAIAISGGGLGSGVIVMDPHAPNALTLSGTAVLSTPDRGIQVNSDNANAIRTVGGPTIDGSDLWVAGDAKLSSNTEVTGDMLTGAPTREDPLSYLVPPAWKPNDDLGMIVTKTGQHKKVDPGYYSGGIDANGGVVTLEPGIYVLDGVGIRFRGNASLYGEGVMIYVKGTGVVDLGGTGVVQLSPPDRTIHDFPGVDLYEGVTIYQDRDNTNGSRIIGTSGLDINGVIYAPTAHYEIGGTGGTYGNALIAGTVAVSGTGVVTIDYDDRWPLPAGPSFLVR